MGSFYPIRERLTKLVFRVFVHKNITKKGFIMDTAAKLKRLLVNCGLIGSMRIHVLSTSVIYSVNAQL